MYLCGDLDAVSPAITRIVNIHENDPLQAYEAYGGCCDVDNVLGAGDLNKVYGNSTSMGIIQHLTVKR